MFVKNYFSKGITGETKTEDCYIPVDIGTKDGKQNWRFYASK